MKKFIFGISMMFTGVFGCLALRAAYPYFTDDAAYYLLILLSIAGFGVAFWEAFCAKAWAKYRSAELTLDILVDGKNTGEKLVVQRRTKADDICAQAKANEGVREALQGKKILDRQYTSETSIDLRTHW